MPAASAGIRLRFKTRLGLTSPTRTKVTHSKSFVDRHLRKCIRSAAFCRVCHCMSWCVKGFHSRSALISVPNCEHARPKSPVRRSSQARYTRRPAVTPRQSSERVDRSTVLWLVPATHPLLRLDEGQIRIVRSSIRARRRRVKRRVFVGGNQTRAGKDRDQPVFSLELLPA